MYFKDSFTKNQYRLNSSSILFPNPASEFINIHITNQLEGDLTLYVYDIHGRVVYEESKNKTTDMIEFKVKNDFSLNGMYLYEVFHNSIAIDSGKFVVNK